MLVRSNNNPKDEKDWLEIGQMEYKEINPFGYKDYKETFDNKGWWKTVEYIDEKGEKVVKDINPFGQVLIHNSVPIIVKEKKRNELDFDDALIDDFDFEDDEIENNEEQHTPEIIDDDKILTQNDFFRMEWKETQYQLYKLLVNISSSLSDIRGS